MVEMVEIDRILTPPRFQVSNLWTVPPLRPLVPRRTMLRGLP
jgi:hypothetical protein